MRIQDEKPTRDPAALRGAWRLAPDPTRTEQLQALWAMSAAERVAAMRAGTLSRHQLFAWAARRPGEVPIVNGEFAFIAMSMADLDPD
jgi:hypothetical protein